MIINTGTFIYTKHEHYLNHQFYVDGVAITLPYQKTWEAKVKVCFYLYSEANIKEQVGTILQELNKKLNLDNPYTVIDDLIIDVKQFIRSLYDLLPDDKFSTIQFAGIIFYKDRFFVFNQGLISIYGYRNGEKCIWTKRNSIADDMVEKGKIGEQKARLLDQYWELNHMNMSTKKEAYQKVFYSESQACYEGMYFKFLSFEDEKKINQETSEKIIDNTIATYHIEGISEKVKKNNILKKILFSLMVMGLLLFLYDVKNGVIRNVEEWRVRYFSEEKLEIQRENMVPKTTKKVAFLLEENLEAVETLPAEEKNSKNFTESVEEQQSQGTKTDEIRETAVKYQEYVVEKGDSLSSISQKFYQNKKGVLRIVEYNQLKDANKIRVGMKLKIPLEE